MGFAQTLNLIKNPSELAKFFGFAPILIGDLIVDVLVTETPSYDYEITEHPVEAGLDITDNRNRKPVGLVLECILADTSFDAKSIISSVISGNLALQMWQDKYKALLELAEKNQIIDVYTPLNVYSSMMIVSVRPSQNKDTANAMFCTVELREIRTVSSEVNFIDSTQIPKKVKEQEKPENTEAAKKTKKKDKKGKQGTSETGDKESSILNDLFG